MILEEMLSDELLQQAAEKYAEAIIASSRRVQSQVFQTVRRKDASTAPAKDSLHHKPKVYIQIARTAVISGSSPFYCSDILKMFICYYSDKAVYFN